MRKQFENQTTQSEKTIRQEARDQMVELNDQQLDMVAGGAKFSGKVFLTNPPDSITVQIFN